MGYRPRHASLSVSAKAATRGAAVVGAAAVAGVIGIGAPAGAAMAPLSVTLGTQAQNDGSSAAWSSAGNPVLTLGSDTATTGAYITFDNAPAEVPATGPTFTTDNYAAGSPRFVITLSNGKALWGYPPNAGLNGSDFAWTVNNGNTYTSWADALTAAGVDSSTTVTGVQIVADGDQASGTSDAITDVSYDGMTIGGGTVSLGSVTTQHATKGTAFSLKDAGTTTSSDPNLTYSASGLPAGLSIDNTGTINGTPGESGQFAVTVHAIDVYGDVSNYQHFVLDVSSGVTYTQTVSARGGISNELSGKCMDVANGLFGRGELVQQYTCGASYNGVKGADQQFQIVTIKGSDGSTKGYLEVVSPSGQVFYVTPTAGAENTQLTLDTSRTTADDMVKSGPYYTFPNTGLVADDAGQSKSNGAAVIGFAWNSGINQRWSMP